MPPEHRGQIVDVICGDRVTAADCGDRSEVGEPRKVVDAAEIASAPVAPGVLPQV